MQRFVWVATTLLLIVPATFVWSAGTAVDCAAVRDAAERLRCYDNVVPPVEAASALGIWAERLMKDARRETFTLTARKPNYILYTAQSEANQEPYEFTGAADRLDEDEIKFQLSFQTKLADDLFGHNGDLWFSYTQVSFWQLFSSDISAPFRETSYEPDVYVSFLTAYPFLGLTARSVNIGVVHQSNGRAEPLSRSWNRVYAEFLFERGDFGLGLKPWVRIEEDEKDDNNPDIEDYLGHYELRAYYHWNGHIFTTMLRNVFSEDERYNAELQWSFPIIHRLRGLVQWYNGYGENLIDNDHHNHRLGIGVVLTDWL